MRQLERNALRQVLVWIVGIHTIFMPLKWKLLDAWEYGSNEENEWKTKHYKVKCIPLIWLVAAGGNASSWLNWKTKQLNLFACWAEFEIWVHVDSSEIFCLFRFEQTSIWFHESNWSGSFQKIWPNQFKFANVTKHADDLKTHWFRMKWKQKRADLFSTNRKRKTNWIFWLIGEWPYNKDT